MRPTEGQMDQQQTFDFVRLTDGPTDRVKEKTLTLSSRQTDRWTNRQSEGEKTFDFVLLTDGPTDRVKERNLDFCTRPTDRHGPDRQKNRLTDGPTDRVKERKPLTLSYKKQTDRWTNRQSEGENLCLCPTRNRLTDGPTDRVKERKPLTLSYKKQTDRWTNRQSGRESKTFDFVLQETD
ncbi:unnamed protein product [Mytilus edulis]|uniref:Uncharacterized protein n=1 Tax=Mytilus edulis TaxID=6550 RepID=A0A8S3UDA2_MYTED|nr:unnamed protein product [Mytilus edulis]